MKVYHGSILSVNKNNEVFRYLVENRGRIVFVGNDAPCTEPDPIVWLSKAVNHSNPKQAVSVEEALRMATYNGYWASFDEKERGSLEEGKLADMVILSANPYTVPKEELSGLKVEELILQGKAYRPQTQSIPAVILKGMLRHNRAQA